MGIRIRRIERAKDFVALEQLWSKLANESGRTSPFLSHDWFWCCWHAVWPQRRPEILLLEDEGSPVAVVPLMRWKERLHGLPVRYLGFLDYPDSPVVDVLSAGDDGQVIEAFQDHLAGRSDWDVVSLPKLPDTSPTLKMLEESLPARFTWRRAGILRSPYLTIAGEWTDVYAEKSQTCKKTCQMIQGRLEHAGRVSVEEHRAVDPGSPLLAEAIDLMCRSRKASPGRTVATLPRTGQFFNELTRRATKNGWLSLWFLRLDGRPIAVAYQLQAHGKVHTLRTDCDRAHGDLLPTSALNFAIIRSLFERSGVYEYDMGPGLSEYKLQWATGSHTAVHLKLYRPGIYARLLYQLETMHVPRALKWRTGKGRALRLAAAWPASKDVVRMEHD